MDCIDCIVISIIKLFMAGSFPDLRLTERFLSIP